MALPGRPESAVHSGTLFIRLLFSQEILMRLPLLQHCTRIVFGAVLCVCAGTASADIPVDLSVDGGSTVTVQLSVTFTTDLIEETQVDSVTVPVNGGGRVQFRPDYEPFSGVTLESLQFNVGDGALNYQFLCDSIFGCVPVDVTLTNISTTLVAPTSGDFDTAGRANFSNALWNVRAQYSISSALLDSDGELDTTSEINFGANFGAGGGDVFVFALSLGSIASELDGTLQVGLLTEFDLSNTTLSGSYEPLPPPNCGSNGPCGEADDQPGCDNVDCCATVCETDFYCCEIKWDAACVNRAVDLCGVTPANDTCANARPLELGRFPFTTRNCTTDGPWLITECANDQTGGLFENDVWFTHTPLADNAVMVSTCGHADFDTQIAIYDQCDGTLIACNDDSSLCPDGTSRAGFFGVAGETYLIRVGSAFETGTGEIDLGWTNLDQPYADIAVEWPTASGGNGHFYTLYALGTGTTFGDAFAAAERFGGYPATLTSPEETDFVVRNMPATLLGGPTAFGLAQTGDDEPGGGWEWGTGEPLTWTNWAPGEPNDFSTGGEDWGVLYPDGTWNDNPNNAAYVLIEFDSDPNVDEVTWSKEDGGNGHTYQGVVLPERVDWTEARIYAENRGGTLVCLETLEESEWVFENMAAFAPLWSMTDYNGGPWVGLFERRGEWVWLSDVNYDGANWFPGEPNGTGNRGCYFAYPDFSSGFTEDFGGTPEGTLFGAAQYADVFGNNRLKLVSDGFAGTWGTWTAPPIERTVRAFTATFRFSFKNENSGPGDGFSMIWGDLSDTSGNRMEGGEFGVFAFGQDQEGLAIGFNSYPALGQNSVDGRWGSERFVQVPLDFSSVTYSDYETAGRPESMPTVTVQWRYDTGVTVTIAFPFNNPQVIYSNAGITELEGIDPNNWSFGFAARNGGIDQDVLIGDVSVVYEYIPETGGLTGGPRNTFDDTFEENQRKTIIIEYTPVVIDCLGDLNGDDVVNGADLTLVLGAWGSDDATADLNDDGTVNGADLTLLLGAWGACSE